MTREKICEAAHKWLGTPYAHHASLIGVGVDCARFPIAVYSEAGLIDAVDPAYTRDWHLHRDAELYLDWVLKLGAVEIDQKQARDGDLGLWRWGRTYSHGGILLAPDLLIHAVQDVGVTLDNPHEEEELRRRSSRWFTFWSAP